MKKLLLLAVYFLIQGAFAQSGVRLGDPEFIGTGCNKRNSSAVISEDGQTLSILFDEYQAEAGGNIRRMQDRKGCNVMIPINVPQGYSVAVMKVDYRGYNSLPAGAQSEFSVDYFFGGRLGPRYTTTFKGPLDEDFITKNNMTSANVVWSPCGRPMLLRAHSVMKVATNAQREQSLSTVDSADVQAGLVYQLQWKRCTL